MTGLNATRYAKCGLAAAAAMAAVSGASAAQISWGAASDFDDATDVVNNGSVVQAVSSSAQTVNGVAFSAVAPIGDFNSGGQYGNGTFLGLTGNSDFDQLAASHQYEGGDLLSTITLSGLTATQQYSFQFFIVDTRYGGTFSARTVVLGDNSGGTASTAVGRSNVAGTAGQTITGTFTADAATQDITFTTTDGNGAITGYVVSEIVPEPGSLALLGLGGLMMLRRRRV